MTAEQVCYAQLEAILRNNPRVRALVDAEPEQEDADGRQQEPMK